MIVVCPKHVPPNEHVQGVLTGLARDDLDVRRWLFGYAQLVDRLRRCR